MSIKIQPYEVDACARHAHEGHRIYRQLMGDLSHKPWDEIDVVHRQPVYVAVIGIVESDDDAVRSHERWVQNLTATGWTKGEKKDGERKTHPNLVPWEDLPNEVQELNKMFVRSVKSMITALWHLPS